MTKASALLLCVSVGLATVAAQDRSDNAAKADRASEATVGKAIFQQNCSFCHGQDGRGASAPDLIRSTLVNHDVDGDLIAEVVHNGRPDKGMPAFQLPDAQIRGIAAFLHQQGKLASTVASRIPTDYPVEQLLVGNAADGKAYFNGAGKCAQCHSPTGDLAHIASKYKPLELQSRIVFPYGAKSMASLTDSSGHQFTGELVYADEFFVTLLTNGIRQTWNRRTAKVEIRDPLAAHVALLTQYTDKDIHDLFAYLESLK
jgi:cytochrome c oxidase cbb3-type subunit III